MGYTCVAHHHRALVPIEVHHVWPLGKGGPDVEANRVPLCANAHGAVHYLLDAALKAGNMDRVPWSYKRRFGTEVRRLALLGWQRIQRQAL